MHLGILGVGYSSSMGFREDHVWGVATASYQIEGASGPTDRGRNVWDMLCDKPGAIFEGHSGAEACDHVRRYQEDVALMKLLGMTDARDQIGLGSGCDFGEGIGIRLLAQRKGDGRCITKAAKRKKVAPEGTGATWVSDLC